MRRQALPVSAYNHIPKKEIPLSLRERARERE
jgi:hypothetical protein